jgi:beta-N-acetylglucosaminidase
MTEQERIELKNEVREEILAEIREAQRLYQKEWRKRNPDKVKASTERYWLKKAKEIMEKENK